MFLGPIMLLVVVPALQLVFLRKEPPEPDEESEPLSGRLPGA